MIKVDIKPGTAGRQRNVPMVKEGLQDSLGDHLVQMAYFLHYRLIYGGGTLLCRQFLDEAVEGRHSQQVLFIV